MTTACGSLFSIFPTRVAWRQVADDIKQASPGLSYNRQAAAIGAEWSTFGRWLTGSEPRHSYGQALLKLHELICGPDLTQKRLTGGEREA